MLLVGGTMIGRNIDLGAWECFTFNKKLKSIAHNHAVMLLQMRLASLVLSELFANEEPVCGFLRGQCVRCPA